MNVPTLVAKPAVDGSQLTKVRLTLDEVVTYRDGESSRRPLLIKVNFAIFSDVVGTDMLLLQIDLSVDGFIPIEAIATFSLMATLDIDATSLAVSAPIEFYVVQIPKQTVYLSNSSLSSTKGANVTLGELLTLRVAIVVSRGRFEVVRVNVTVPFEIGEGSLNIIDATVAVIGDNIVQSGADSVQLADHW